MKFLLIAFVLVTMSVASAQTDRHGQSNGTVTDLPVPQVFHDPQSITELPSTAHTIPQDEQVTRIEAQYQVELDRISSQLDRSLPAEFRRLAAEIETIKVRRDVAILEHLRSQAQLRDDEVDVQQINSRIETLTARGDARRVEDRKSGGTK